MYNAVILIRNNPTIAAESKNQKSKYGYRRTGKCRLFLLAFFCVWVGPETFSNILIFDTSWGRDAYYTIIPAVER